MRILFALVATALLAGPALAAGESVQLVSDPAAVSSCERRGEVTSSSALGGLLTGAGYKRAVASLKKKAAALGATHLHLLNANSNYAGSNMLAIAYRCPAAN